MSLRTKLVLALIVCTWLVSAAVGLLSYRATARALYDEIDTSVVDAVRDAATGPGRFRRGGPPARLVAPREVDLQLVTTAGRVGFGSTGTEIPVEGSDLELAGARTPGQTVMRDDEVAGEPARVATSSLGEGRGAVMGARSTEEVKRVLDALRARILIVSVAVAAAAGLVGVFLARSITGRLTRLTEAAEHVAESGELKVDIPREGADETARLGRAFDDMLDALSQSSRRQQRLVQDAGHELRTPMTSLRTNLYSLRDIDALGPEERSRVVADLEAEAAELTGLIEDVLVVAGGDEVDEVTQVVDVVALARSESARVVKRWGRSVVTVPDHRIDAECRRAQLARAVRNLVDNACKFSPDGSPVEVALWATPDGPDAPAGVALEVRDRGPGIAAEDLGLIFERFHRADAARALPGSGLGLSIVSDVAEVHRGRVWARDLADTSDTDTSQLDASDLADPDDPVALAAPQVDAPRGSGVGLWIPVAVPDGPSRGVADRSESTAPMGAPPAPTP